MLPYLLVFAISIFATYLAQITLKKHFSEFDLVETRDEKSALGYNVKFGLDDAFLRLKKTEASKYDCIPDVMICIQSDLVSTNIYHKVIRKIKYRIKEYLDKGLTVGYIEALPNSDEKAYHRLKSHIPANLYFKLEDILKYGLPVKQDQIWYTSRFHHHLIASALGAKGVILSFKPGYYDIKHQSLLDLGTGWSCYSSYHDEDIPYPSLGENYQNKAMEYANQKETLAINLYQ